jgi:hypothetical protein
MLEHCMASKIDRRNELNRSGDIQYAGKVQKYLHGDILFGFYLNITFRSGIIYPLYLCALMVI